MIWVNLIRLAWARWPIILFSLIASLCGAAYALSTLTSLYRGSADVLMELVRPSEETGQTILSQMTESYVGTQVRLASSPAVAGRMIDAAGWADDPAIISSYAEATGGVSGDIRGWLAARMSRSIYVSIPADTNILRIGYGAPDPVDAARLSGMLRDAYLAEALDQQVGDARRTVDSMRARAGAMLVQYRAAAARRREYAALHGIAIGPQANSSERVERLWRQLSQLSRTGRSSAVRPAPVITSPGGGMSPRDSDSQTAGAGMSATGRRDLTFVRMQRELDLAEARYVNFARRALEAENATRAQETNLKPSGIPKADDTPFYPSWPRALALAAVFGLVIGIQTALMTEFIARRVRGTRDLVEASGEEVLGVITRSSRRLRLRLPFPSASLLRLLHSLPRWRRWRSSST